MSDLELGVESTGFLSMAFPPPEELKLWVGIDSWAETIMEE